MHVQNSRLIFRGKQTERTCTTHGAVQYRLKNVPKSKQTTNHKNETKDTVEYATIRLTSASNTDMAKQIRDKIMSGNSGSEYWVLFRNRVKRPAITRVQECSSAETGVGPSIASESKVAQRNNRFST